MILMIDNYDSFTYNLVNYLEMLGEQVLVKRNDSITIEEILELSPGLIVISPGPGSPSDSEISMEILNSLKTVFPILGICLGFQVIASYFGGKIVRGQVPVHGKVFDVFHDGKGIFTDIESPTKVTRYHSLILEEDSLPDELEISAKTSDGTIMAIRHKKFKISGVQFHPEALLTEYGFDMLKNALRHLEGK